MIAWIYLLADFGMAETTEDDILAMIDEAKLYESNIQFGQKFENRIAVAREALRIATEKAEVDRREAHKYFEASRMIAELGASLPTIPPAPDELKVPTPGGGVAKGVGTVADAVFWSQVLTAAAAVERLGRGMEKYKDYESFLKDYIDGKYTSRISEMEGRLKEFYARNQDMRNGLLGRLQAWEVKQKACREQLEGRQTKLRSRLSNLREESSVLQRGKEKLDLDGAAYREALRRHERERTKLDSLVYDQCPNNESYDNCSHEENKRRWRAMKNERRRRLSREAETLRINYETLKTARARLEAMAEPYIRNREEVMAEDKALRMGISQFKSNEAGLNEVRQRISRKSPDGTPVEHRAINNN